MDWTKYAVEKDALHHVDEAVRKFSAEFRENNGRGPGGTTSEQYRRSLLLQYAPMSALFRRMAVLGNPKSIHTKEAQTKELDAILEELDRRFPNG